MKVEKSKLVSEPSAQAVLFAKEYDVHGMSGGETIRCCDQWIKNAYQSGTFSIAVIHGNTRRSNPYKLNKFYDWLRNNELIESFCSPASNPGRVYISVKKK